MNSRIPWVLAEELEGSGPYRLDERESRHLRKVLRKRVGDPVIVIDGRGGLGEAEILEFRRSTVVLDILRMKRSARQEEGPEILLGILQGRAMDWAVQKSVELGVGRLVPLRTARCQSSDMADRRMEHWKLLGRQALKQCHRVWEMEIVSPMSLEEMLREKRSPGWVADIGGREEEGLLHEAASRMIVGPEGGLREDEKQRLFDAGWMAISLGRHVLRAETAALVAAVFLSRCR